MTIICCSVNFEEPLQLIGQHQCWLLHQQQRLPAVNMSRLDNFYHLPH